MQLLTLQITVLASKPKEQHKPINSQNHKKQNKIAIWPRPRKQETSKTLKNLKKGTITSIKQQENIKKLIVYHTINYPTNQ
jgi:hypothetical protein